MYMYVCVCVCLCVCIGIGSVYVCVYNSSKRITKESWGGWQILIDDKIESEGFLVGG